MAKQKALVEKPKESQDELISAAALAARMGTEPEALAECSFLPAPNADGMYRVKDVEEFFVEDRTGAGSDESQAPGAAASNTNGSGVPVSPASGPTPTIEVKPPEQITRQFQRCCIELCFASLEDTISSGVEKPPKGMMLDLSERDREILWRFRVGQQLAGHKHTSTSRGTDFGKEVATVNHYDFFERLLQQMGIACEGRV